jgi:hypothetical protein
MNACGLLADLESPDQNIRPTLPDPVPLEYSIERLACALFSIVDAVMVGWPPVGFITLSRSLMR